MNTSASTNTSRAATVLMGLVAASLAVSSVLHLSGLDAGGSGANPTAAGVAEAVICVVLAWATAMLIRRGAAARASGLGATGFAIVGFGYGLSQTAPAGYLPDLLYHAIGLPVLIVAFVLLLFVKRPSGGAVNGSARDSRTEPSHRPAGR